MTIETTTNEVGAEMLRQYMAGKREGTFTIGADLPPPPSDLDPGVQPVTLTYED